MSRFYIADPRTNVANEIDFPIAITLLKGTSIISLADAENFFELGLSRVSLRIESSGNLNASVISTLNPDEMAPVRLQLVGADEEPTAALVEERLRSLRQVYAIIYLLNDGREEALAEAIRQNPNIDVERSLLKDDQKLRLQAAGPGSWYVTAFSKVRGAGQKVCIGSVIRRGAGPSTCAPSDRECNTS